MAYELLVLDLDGTLTTSEKTISPKTKEAIMKLQEAGKKVVLASGRPTPGIVPLAKELELEKYGSYILSFNGGCIINCATDEIVYEAHVEPRHVPKLYEVAERYGVNLSTYNGDIVYTGFAPNDQTRLECRVCHLTAKILENFVEEIDFPMNKLLVAGDADKLAKMEVELKEYFKDELNIYRSEPYFIEVMPPLIDKAYGLSKMLEILGIKREEMICCGDGFNDLTMIEYAGLGVAMANAQQVVLDAADYVTLSNNDDGIAHVIEKFMMD